MKPRFIPSRRLAQLVAIAFVVATVALFMDVGLALVSSASLAFAALLVVLVGVDVWMTRRAWRQAQVRMTRRLPSAFAIGVRQLVHLQFENTGTRALQFQAFDHCDPGLRLVGLPAQVDSQPGKRFEIAYEVTPTRRGEIEFDTADVRVRSRLGFCELMERAGDRESRRSYPDFAQVARYAWLAGDRRLQEIGIKTYQQRGEGTDFKQLAEYRYGDSVRHIDWKATLRQHKPILREFQDERDQCVMLLVDCGRRMRADEGPASGRLGHFDAALDALMLMAWVALKEGDAVGAVTFGGGATSARAVAPRKGLGALDALIATLHDVEPQPLQPDYRAAAVELMGRLAKRSMVIVLTNFRDEDASEFKAALSLLRTRHLVLVASLRERVLRELAEQPLVQARDAIEVAGAHLFAQARDAAFRRLAARHSLMLDVEPEQLAVALVNRYHAVKRAGLL